MSTPYPHLRIRPHTYRGREGFALSGHGVRIFDRDRRVVEAIREAMRDPMLDRDAQDKRIADLLMRRLTPDGYIPDDLMLSWESQVCQYPERGDPGIGYFAGETEQGTVDCLLMRDEAGAVVGILNHYPIDMPPWEKAGSVNVWTHPEKRRQGIATALLREAMRRWNIDLAKQRYSVTGARFVRAFVEREGKVRT